MGQSKPAASIDSSIDSCNNVISWVTSLTALRVTPDAALAAYTAIVVARANNEHQSVMADKAIKAGGKNESTNS